MFNKRMKRFSVVIRDSLMKTPVRLCSTHTKFIRLTTPNVKDLK